ncbi:MAG: hypothetical protein ABR972_11660 [Acidimicrobiales bacterium]
MNTYRAAVTAEELHSKITHHAVVWRDARQQGIDVTALVPDDVLALGVGDIVPVDTRLLEADELECDEAVLTGESMPVARTWHLSPRERVRPRREAAGDVRARGVSRYCGVRRRSR